MTSPSFLRRTRPTIAVVLVYLVGAAAAAGGGLAMAPLVALAALIAIPASVPLRPIRIGLPALTAAALAVWLAASLFWTPTPKAEVRYAQAFSTALAGALLSAGLLHARGDRLAQAIALGGVALLGLLLVIDVGFGFPISRIGRENDEMWIVARSASKGVAILALLGWCAALAFAHRPWRSTAIAGLVAILVAGLGVAIDMSAAVLAAVLGCVTWCAALVWPRFALQAVGIAIAAIILGAPFFMLPLSAENLSDSLPYSWGQRLEVWRSATAHIFESPVVGHGFDSSRAFASQSVVYGAPVAAIPLHPHNLGLQLWLEGGGVAAALAAALCVITTRRVGTVCTPAISRAATAVFTCWCVFSMLSFGAWQEWWIASLGAATALLALFAKHDPPSDAMNP